MAAQRRFPPCRKVRKMATYDYETTGEKFIAARTKAVVHRVYEVGDHKKTVCECYDFDSLMTVLKALNAYDCSAFAAQAAHGDVVA